MVMLIEGSLHHQPICARYDSRGRIVWKLRLIAWRFFSCGMSLVNCSIRVQIRSTDSLQGVGRSQTDYRAVESGYSAWKSYDSMAKYQSIQTHSLALQSRANTRFSFNAYPNIYQLPKQITTNSTILPSPQTRNPRHRILHPHRTHAPSTPILPPPLPTQFHLNMPVQIHQPINIALRLVIPILDQHSRKFIFRSIQSLARDLYCDGFASTDAAPVG